MIKKNEIGLKFGISLHFSLLDMTSSFAILNIIHILNLNTRYDYFFLLSKHVLIINLQVRIKIAIDNTQTNQRWKFWQKNIKDNRYRRVLPPSAWSKKEDEFIKAKKLVAEEEIKRKKNEFKLVKDDLERYRQRTNTQIIVTALITTVTFTVGFTMPGGYHQSGEHDQGLVLLSKKTAFNAFMVSDALALLLSTSSLFLYFMASMYDDPHQVSKLKTQYCINGAEYCFRYWNDVNFCHRHICQCCPTHQPSPLPFASSVAFSLFSSFIN